MKKLDELPTGTPWICDVITVNGTLTGPNGQLLTEELELWRRDPVDCVRELMGNPAFKPYMSLKPVRVSQRGVRYYGEMNTSEWWWHTQVRVPYQPKKRLFSDPSWHFVQHAKATRVHGKGSAAHHQACGQSSGWQWD